MPTPDLGNPKRTIEILQKYRFSFQKRYGQNFLIDPHVLEKIVAAAEVGKEDLVLEIGPGIGTLTQYLAAAARKVIAVEIDDRLLPVLEMETEVIAAAITSAAILFFIIFAAFLSECIKSGNKTTDLLAAVYIPIPGGTLYRYSPSKTKACTLT